jgi:hypothetical protein
VPLTDYALRHLFPLASHCHDTRQYGKSLPPFESLEPVEVSEISLSGSQGGILC